MNNSKNFAIAALVKARCDELGLRRSALVERAGYKNVGKGIRRLDALMAGDLQSTAVLVKGLPCALSLDPAVVDRAIEETRRQVTDIKERERAAEEARWRASFEPHAIILTERIIPHPIHVVAWIGVERLLVLKFDPDGDPESYISKALKALDERLAESVIREIPAFGAAVGLVVNYSPDFAVRFDLSGTPIEMFNRAHRLGHASLLMHGKPILTIQLV